MKEWTQVYLEGVREDIVDTMLVEPWRLGEDEPAQAAEYLRLMLALEEVQIGHTVDEKVFGDLERFESANEDGT